MAGTTIGATTRPGEGRFTARWEVALGLGVLLMWHAYKIFSLLPLRFGACGGGLFALPSGTSSQR